jgi:hypothetical protein
LSRFGDTAANTGILTLLNSLESTKDVNVGIKTVACSVAAGLFRIVLMPVDTVKTTMQVTGKFSSVVDKIKLNGPLTLWNGSIAAASATFVGHYPYVFIISHVVVRFCWRGLKKLTHFVFIIFTSCIHDHHHALLLHYPQVVLYVQLLIRSHSKT